MAGRRLPDFRMNLFGSRPLSNHHRSVSRNVTFQVLPLRGDMARMRQFINSYLNFVDDDYPAPFYFKPALPYVMLEVIDYPFLAVTSENTTVLSQHEVAFTVPLECYAIEHGERVFVDYASCTPFLYLDVQPTIISGRDVFGLPKIAVKFCAVELPMRPGQPGQILDMQLRLASRDGDDYRRFIEISSDPPRYRAGVEDMFTAIPKAWARWSSISSAMWEQMTQLPTISGYERTRDLDSMSRMARANWESRYATVPLLAPYRAALGRYASTADIRLAPGVFENISLKQFRDAEDTDAACYQSVVRSAMYLDRMNDAGPLYDPQIGDPTGGINIKFYYTESQPLIDSFGLRVEDVTDTRDGPISTIKPDFPFWQNVDLSYALGTNLYWRAINSRWSEGDDIGPPNRPGEDPTKPPTKPGEDPTEYITFGGGALQELPQRFVSPESFVWIIGLPLSDQGQKKLQKLCDEYLNNDKFHFTAQFPFAGFEFNGKKSNGHVFMLVYHTLNSTEGFGVERAREIEFAIPVQWSWKDSKDGKNPIGYAVFPLYSFCDSESATITQSEVFGRPTLLADVKGLILDEMTHQGTSNFPVPERKHAISDRLENWPDVFRGADPPFVDSYYPVPVLDVSTSLLRALYTGEAPQDRLLVQVVAGGPAKNTQAGSIVGIYGDLSIGRPVYLPWVGFKQVVDCRLPKKASYQAIVMQPMKIDPKSLTRQSSSELSVKMHRYEAIPMAEKMGLELESKPGEKTTVDTIKADFAVWVHLGLEAQSALNAYSWIGTEEYHSDDEEVGHHYLRNGKDIDEAFLNAIAVMVALEIPPIPPFPWPTIREPFRSKLEALYEKLKKRKEARAKRKRVGPKLEKGL